jgi:hypothetical protein
MTFAGYGYVDRGRVPDVIRIWLEREAEHPDPAAVERSPASGLKVSLAVEGRSEPAQLDDLTAGRKVIEAAVGLCVVRVVVRGADVHYR